MTVRMIDEQSHAKTEHSALTDTYKALSVRSYRTIRIVFQPWFA